jgi:cephalosporin hydroxylase
VKPIDDFQLEVASNVAKLKTARELQELSRTWLRESLPFRYSYNFSWLGRPIIQYPQDIVAMQELIWKINPDLIVETGIAHGGSLVLSASMLALLDYRDASVKGSSLDVRASKRRVIGVDIELRPHNQLAIERHPLAHKIEMIQGSSVAAKVVSEVHRRAVGHDRVLVLLDSNHTHDHVLAELRAYAPLVSRGSYCVVFDTVVEELPADAYPHRPWGPGNSPMTAVSAFLHELAAQPMQGLDGGRLRFDVDRETDARLLVSVAPGGYLKRT